MYTNAHIFGPPAILLITIKYSFLWNCIIYNNAPHIYYITLIFLIQKHTPKPKNTLLINKNTAHTLYNTNLYIEFFND